MMCLPASIGATFVPAAASSGVSFIAATGVNYIASGTTISSPNTPEGVTTGDGLFAIVMALNTSAEPTLTPPSDWTLVDAQLLNYFSSAYVKLFIYRRDSASSGDSSTAFTWTQGAADIMGLGYVLTRSSTGSLTVAGTGKYGTVEFNAATCPVVTATADGEMFLMAASLVSPSTDMVWTAPTGATLRSSGAPNSIGRMGFATQSRDTGQSSGAAFGLSPSGSAGTASISVRLQSA